VQLDEFFRGSQSHRVPSKAVFAAEKHATAMSLQSARRPTLLAAGRVQVEIASCALEVA
jgi:hypothetical protein